MWFIWLRQPSARFTLSLLLAWSLAIFGLFVAGDLSGSSASSERPAVAEVAEMAQEAGAAPFSAPSICEDIEQGAEAEVALVPHSSPELLPLKTGKFVWHRPSLLRPSSVGRKPAFEPPAPSSLLG